MKLLGLDGFSYRYPGASGFALRGVELGVWPGECHVITGPTGSGKSTLALAIKGLLPQGEDSGGLSRGGMDAGLVMQNPETQLLCTTVGSEAAFGLENICVPPEEMGPRVAGALRSVGLEMPLGHDCSKLSMGQKYRLLIASQLSMGRRLIVIDEPSGQVDPDGLAMLCGIIARLKRSGVSFIILEHDAAAFAESADSFWRFEDGRLLAATLPGQPLPAPEQRPSLTARPGERLITASGLSVSGSDGTPLWSDVSFCVSGGELVSLQGPNGSGKTTLLNCIAGLARPSCGELTVLGERPSAARLSGRVGCLMQDPHAQLFEETVYGEVSFTLRRLGHGGAVLKDRVDEALDACGIAGLAGRSPHGLSYGQKRLVSLASVIAHRPPLMLLDDPFSGLDCGRRRMLRGLFETLSSRRGSAVVWTTHNPHDPYRAAAKRLAIENGKVSGYNI